MRSEARVVDNTKGMVSTVCARMRPVTVPYNPQTRKAPKIAAAVMMTGTTSGAIKRPISSEAPRNRTRESAIAAAVPRALAQSEDGIITMTLVRSVAIHTGSAKNLAYHCSEKPGGGNVRKGAALNDRVSTMASGASIIAATSPQTASRSARQGVKARGFFIAKVAAGRRGCDRKARASRLRRTAE